jgi:hypothetical protein
MDSSFAYLPLLVLPVVAVLLVAARRSLPQHSRAAHVSKVPTYLVLWAAIVLLSALEAVVLRLAGTSLGGPAYVGANFFVVLVLLLAGAAAKTDPGGSLLHLFVHVACAMYLRVASWLLFTGSAS